MVERPVDESDSFRHSAMGAKYPFASQAKLRHVAPVRPSGRQGIGGKPAAEVVRNRSFSLRCVADMRFLRWNGRCQSDKLDLDDRAVVNKLFPALNLAIVGDQAIHFRVIHKYREDPVS